MARSTIQINLRIKPELRAQLQQAADTNNASVTEEINRRLEASFEKPDPHSKINEQLPSYALLLLLERAMNAAGDTALFALTGMSWEAARKLNWLNNPYAYDKAKLAALTILEASKPIGEIQKPELEGPWDGQFWGEYFLRFAATGEPNVKENEEAVKSLHKYAGHLAERFRTNVPQVFLGRDELDRLAKERSRGTKVERKS